MYCWNEKLHYLTKIKAKKHAEISNLTNRLSWLCVVTNTTLFRDDSCIQAEMTSWAIETIILITAGLSFRLRWCRVIPVRHVRPDRTFVRLHCPFLAEIPHGAILALGLFVFSVVWVVSTVRARKFFSKFCVVRTVVTGWAQTSERFTTQTIVTLLAYSTLASMV